MLRLIAAGIALSLAGALTHSLLAGIIFAVITFASLRTKAPTKIVMIHDTETGETKGMPMDAATQRYIRAVEKKEGK
jgi:hypothetical protein